MAGDGTQETSRDTAVLAQALKDFTRHSDANFDRIFNALHGKTGANGIAGNVRALQEAIERHIDKFREHGKRLAELEKQTGTHGHYVANEKDAHHFRRLLVLQSTLAVLTVVASGLAAWIVARLT